MTVVGHSFGCLVTVALALSSPQRVTRLVLVSAPVFRDADRARERLGRRGWLARRVLAGSPVASASCGLMCLLRPLAAHIVARLARTVPEAVARDGVEHSWPAYRDALMTLLDANPLPAAIAEPIRPTTVVLGIDDEQTPAGNVLAWPHERVGVVRLPGDHLLPLRRPIELAELIATAVPDY
jgi:pimeloyl-ACP methyl ester carboxylesterase